MCDRICNSFHSEMREPRAGLRCQPRGTALSGGMGSWRWSLSEQPKWSEPMKLGKAWVD